jgi:protein transport protein SEC24
MSDFSTYHALGDQKDEKSQPTLNLPPSSPGLPQSPSVEPPKTAGYVHSGAYPFQANSPGIAPPRSAGFPANAYSLQYGGQGMGSPQGPGFLSPQQTAFMPGSPGPMTSLNSQMASMSVGGSVRKKKDRHAYHTLDQGVGTSQAFNGLPQGSTTPSQFLDSPAPSPFLSSPVTPAMNQFPAPAGTFVPTKPRSGGTAMDVTGSSGRVDPDQIPSIPRSRDVPAEYYQLHTYRTMEQHLPPPAAIPFAAYDQGNSSPKYARLTLNNIPATAEALNATALPLGIILQPLAALSAGEQPVPVLDFGDTGPPRCSRCRTYINPFMTFRSGGNKFVCNMCTFPNDVPPEYFAPADNAGVRVDREERPELKLGTVEFICPKEAWTREPVPLRQLFLIDVTQESVNRGFLEAFCDGILNALYGDIPNDQEQDNGQPPDDLRAIPPGSKVAIVTFDKEAHFYNLNVSFCWKQ